MRFHRWLPVVGAVVGLLSSGLAQAPIARAGQQSVAAIKLPYDQGSSALWQSLRKLQTRASLIMITAHPDDEDGGMLTYYSRGQGARVSLLTLNRGEGGQNVMGHDYFDALGHARTQELLAADRYYGVEQYFTRVADYGFSKTKEEADEKWGHDRVLYDVVRVIRTERPLIVTSVFLGGPTDGHGNHQYAGMITQDVFDAAADPNVFPDQIKAGLLPWKPLKVYSRVPFFAMSDPKGLYDYATGKYVPVRFYDYIHKQWIEGPISTDVQIPSGSYDPILGQSYVQIARTGLGMQKTQTGGTGPAPFGTSSVPYHRWASAVPASDKETSFFDGIDISLLGIADLARGGDTAFLKKSLAEINSAVQDAVSKFNVQQPEAVAPSLVRGLKTTRALISKVEASSLTPESKYNVIHELRAKEQQFNNAVVQSLSLSLLATVAPEKDSSGAAAMFTGGMQETFQVAIPGQQFWVKVTVAKQSSNSLKINNLVIKNANREEWQIQPPATAAAEIANNSAISQRFKVTVPASAGFTRPYFTRPDIEQAYYDVNDPNSLTLPTSLYPLTADLEVNYEGEPVRVSEVVQTVRRATGPGLVLEPLVVGPAISVTMTPTAGIVPLAGTKFHLKVNIHNNVKGEARGTLKLNVPQGWKTSPEQAQFALLKDGEEQHATFEVIPSNLEQKPYKITAVAEYNGQQFTEGYDMTGYEGLRPYPLYKTATFRAHGVDVKIASGLKIGYVMGTGDDVPDSLQDLGIKVQFLSAQDLATGDLSQYDCIVLGVRAYAARPDLITYNGRILQFVQNGGVVFVQYNTGQYDRNYGPYPYTLSNDPEKVVDETAQVAILDPGNPLMNWPNKITPSDFDGWVEERGHSFMKTWDPRYQALTEVHDPDQDEQKGGLLYANYGKGVYIYAAYALYRQLPEGVSGAFRLFANVLSLAHNPQLDNGQSQEHKLGRP